MQSQCTVPTFCEPLSVTRTMPLPITAPLRPIPTSHVFLISNFKHQVHLDIVTGLWTQHHSADVASRHTSCLLHTPPVPDNRLQTILCHDHSAHCHPQTTIAQTATHTLQTADVRTSSPSLATAHHACTCVAASLPRMLSFSQGAGQRLFKPPIQQKTLQAPHAPSTHCSPTRAMFTAWVMSAKAVYRRHACMS